MGLVFWAPKLPLLKKLALLALRGFWLRSARGAGRSGFRLSPEALYITPCDPDPHPGAQEEARSGEWPSFTNFIYANPMRRHLPKDAAVISPQKIGLDARFFKRRVWPDPTKSVGLGFVVFFILLPATKRRRPLRPWRQASGLRPSHGAVETRCPKWQARILVS